ASYGGNFRVFGNLTGTNAASVSDGVTSANIANWRGEPNLRNTFTDGTSNTILFGEKLAQCFSPPGNAHGGNMWDRWDWLDYWQPTFAAFVTGTASMFQASPRWDTSACNAQVAQSYHNGGMNACLADGSVRFLSASMTATTWWSACTPNGG